MDYLLIFLSGFFAGIQYFGWHIRKHIKQLAKEEGVELEDGPANEQELPLMKTELHGNTIYLYDKSNQFVCQGSTLDELAKKVLEYKNIKMALVIHNTGNFVFMDGEVKKAVIK